MPREPRPRRAHAAPAAAGTSALPTLGRPQRRARAARAAVDTSTVLHDGAPSATTPCPETLDPKFCQSENGAYIIYDFPDKFIFVKDGADAPRGSVPLPPGAPLRDEGDQLPPGYTAYTSDLFHRDCMHTAEELNAGRPIPWGLPDNHPDSMMSKLVATDDWIGLDDQSNIDAAQRALREHPEQCNDNAAPEVGQSYLIVREDFLTKKKWPKAVSPFHVAPVVAKDGTHRITLEVAATSKPGKARDTQGEYSMFPVDPKDPERNTFNTQMASTDYPNSITTVIRTKQPGEVYDDPMDET